MEISFGRIRWRSDGSCTPLKPQNWQHANEGIFLVRQQFMETHRPCSCCTSNQCFNHVKRKEGSNIATQECSPHSLTYQVCSAATRTSYPSLLISFPDVHHNLKFCVNVVPKSYSCGKIITKFSPTFSDVAFPLRGGK